MFLIFVTPQNRARMLTNAFECLVITLRSLRIVYELQICTHLQDIRISVTAGLTRELCDAYVSQSQTNGWHGYGTRERTRKVYLITRSLHFMSSERVIISSLGE